MQCSLKFDWFNFLIIIRTWSCSLNKSNNQETANQRLLYLIINYCLNATGAKHYAHQLMQPWYWWKGFLRISIFPPSNVLIKSRKNQWDTCRLFPITKNYFNIHLAYPKVLWRKISFFPRSNSNWESIFDGNVHERNSPECINTEKTRVMGSSCWNTIYFKLILLIVALADLIRWL